MPSEMAVVRLLRQTATLDRNGVELRYGIRCTIGVAIPLVLAFLGGAPLAGVSAAFGAMSAGFASRQGVYRTRAAAMLLTTAAMAFSAYVGGLFGARPVEGVVLVALWGFGLGILGALGASATTVGLNAAIALLIFGHPPYGPATALSQAVFVLAGGALQTLLLVLVWPLQRFTAERRVLAEAYRTLATYAEDLPSLRLGSPAPLDRVTAALADPQPFARRIEIAAFEALLDEAGRLRASLAALATDGYVLTDHGYADAAVSLRMLGADAAIALREIASALDDARAPADLGAFWHAIDLHLTAIERELADVGGAVTVADARAFLGQLRAAWRAAGVPADAAAASPVRPRAPSPFALSALGDALQTLRANLSPRSVYMQHALRLGAMLTVASIAERVLPLQRAYWIPLTAVIVMRADFTTTITLGLARMGGTVAGALIASLIAVLLHPAPPVYLTLAIVFAAASYTLLSANYALFATTITGYVVFLLAFAGIPESGVAFDRVGATLIGSGIALAAYALRPTWAREQVPDALADLLDAQRRYARSVLRAYLDPAQTDEAAIRFAQQEAWRARSAAEASVAQMIAEPVHTRAISVRTALGLLAAGRRYGAAALTLHSRLARTASVAQDELATLTHALEEAMDALAAALRARPIDAPALPALRDTQIALKRKLDAHPDPDLEAIVAETDLMVDSVDTMADVLRRNVH